MNDPLIHNHVQRDGVVRLAIPHDSACGSFRNAKRVFLSGVGRWWVPLKITPATAAGVTSKLWEMVDMVKVLEDWKTAPRGQNGHR